MAKARKMSMFFAVFLSVMLLFSACSNTSENETSTPTDSNETSTSDSAQTSNPDDSEISTQANTDEDENTIDASSTDEPTDTTGTPDNSKPSKPTDKPSPTQQPTKAAEKKGDLYKAAGDSKIWANTVGQAYILFRNIDKPNEWGEKGQVYEIYVAQFGDDFSMWSDGYWKLNDAKTQLTLTPKNQSDNGNIGVGEGESKTFTGNNGVFAIDLKFSSGGKTKIQLDLAKNALQ